MFEKGKDDVARGKASMATCVARHAGTEQKPLLPGNEANISVRGLYRQANTKTER